MSLTADVRQMGRCLGRDTDKLASLRNWLRMTSIQTQACVAVLRVLDSMRNGHIQPNYRPRSWQLWNSYFK
jgi:hypothetical protein